MQIAIYVAAADPAWLAEDAPMTTRATLILVSMFGGCCTYMPLVLACIVGFCLLFYRANAGLRASGVDDLRDSPGWSVGWFFVPLANYVMPHRVASDLWRASAMPAPGESASAETGRRARVAFIVDAWWIVFVASIVTDQIVNVADSLESRWARNLPATTAVLVLHTLAVVLAWRFVGALSRRVDARMAFQPQTPLPEVPWN